uniref:Uncharacterized protein n=1 Tax=Arundo donax TaxID=35708 RepID=A0A0A9FWZ7_ARUDO
MFIHPTDHNLIGWDEVLSTPNIHSSKLSQIYIYDPKDKVFPS